MTLSVTFTARFAQTNSFGIQCCFLVRERKEQNIIERKRMEVKVQQHAAMGVGFEQLRRTRWNIPCHIRQRYMFCDLIRGHFRKKNKLFQFKNRFLWIHVTRKTLKRVKNKQPPDAIIFASLDLLDERLPRPHHILHPPPPHLPPPPPPIVNTPID